MSGDEESEDRDIGSDITPPRWSRLQKGYPHFNSKAEDSGLGYIQDPKNETDYQYTITII
jgi:hypothetical protein